MFIPGVYHVRIAFLAFRGYEGFSFEDIPEFNWHLLLGMLSQSIKCLITVTNLKYKPSLEMSNFVYYAIYVTFCCYFSACDF